MVLEVAILNVRPGTAQDFVAAFREASPYIAASPGYLGHQLHHCLEDATRYLLLVQWQTLEDHTEGFRGSARYEPWRQILHHFYDPFPTVEHYELVMAKPP